MPFQEYKYTFVQGKDALIAVDLATGDDMTLIGHVHDDIVVESSLTASMLNDLAKKYLTEPSVLQYASYGEGWKPKRRRGYKKQTTWDFLKK